MVFILSLILIELFVATNKSMTNTIYTIGHSTHTSERFLALLTLHNIQAIADVRSAPYSRFNPQFNQEALKQSSAAVGIKYVYLGNELGARRAEPECYVEGRAEYSQIVQLPIFAEGIKRLLNGSSRLRIALLCSEKEPLECHRCILIAPQLKLKGLSVKHIHADGNLEDHYDVESRLLKLWNFTESELFKPREDLVADALKLQSNEIAYKEGATEQITHEW
jgi:uncharacterized protein (DUF488 family)